jgi:ectoine hydroxylase-related dioxygenase (phytanoyl-CoA dioxygenase family)
MVTSDGYLTSGVGYAHHPHRDTWYSAPMCQLNWWLPIYDIDSESSMAFHPAYWSRPVKNGSSEFNYYEWNTTGRKDAAKHIKSDTRKQPKPEEPMELDPQIRFVVPAGGLVLFSAAHMHSTVPNTSGRARYSIDFRTVHLDEVESQGGAPNVDSQPVGTSLRDFKRASDLTDMPEELVTPYDDRAAHVGELVYQPGS